MPASNPGRTGSGNSGTADGVAVICSPFSGPTNSPLDARTITGWVGGSPTYANDPANVTTGALSTGIGFGIGTGNYFTGAPLFSAGNFSDNYEPGLSLPGGTAAPDATLTAIGGGRSDPDGTPDPYSAVPLLGFGNGGTRDAGAGPAFTGFGMKTVTATGNVAHGAAIEAGWLNRVKPAFGLVSGQSAFGSANAASPAPTELIN
jgi:hypothetical protein